MPVRLPARLLLAALFLCSSAQAALAQQDRPIPSWLVVGTWSVDTGPQRFSRDYLGDESDAAPERGDAVQGRSWREAAADSMGRVDLRQVFTDPPVEQAAAYAFSWLTVPEDRTVTLAFESDDDLKVWLNGMPVLEREVARSVGGPVDTVTVRLAKGANRLLAKIINRSGGFGLAGRLVEMEATPTAQVRATPVRPDGVQVATAPAPTLTLAPLSVAASAVLDAATGALRVPVVAHAARWGGLAGTVTVAVGSRQAALPAAPDGEVSQVSLPTTWSDLVDAAKEPQGVRAGVEDGASFGRVMDAGAVLGVLSRPIAVEGWRWRASDGAWQAVPEAGPYGVDPAVVRQARTLAFRATVPEALAGLGLALDLAEFASTGAAVRVNTQARTPDDEGRVRLCDPCRAGETLEVELDPTGQWWDPPRLVVPDAGWTEISQGARWADFFTADGAYPGVTPPEKPGPDVARALLSATADADKARYHALVSEWMGKLEPASRAIQADTIDIVGNAHIDAAWLWRWEETVDVVRNTWRTASKLLEKTPDMTFAGSAAAYYVWLEAYEPALLARLQELQREGRWAPVGGWWVEADANLPSGEALVRQALYGQRTYQRLFGTTAKVAWIPDTFGYAYTLPQIFLKSGFNAFVTQKLRWNDTHKWTADKNLFWWQGRDGSQILTYIPYGYTHDLRPTSLADEWKATRDSTAARRMLVLYGVGDHGGGPTMEMLDRARALKRVPTFPVLRGTTPAAAMDRMRGDAGGAPVIDDELYLEYHRGVSTSQSEMKAHNRHMENLLAAAEAAASHATFYAPDEAWYNYPRGALDDAWHKTLFNQFHDLLPGSGIGPIYADAMADYAEADRLAEMTLDRAGEMIAAGLDTRLPEANDQPFVVLNPSGHARSGEVRVPWTGGAATAVDADGAPLASAVTDGALRVRVSDVPATGGAVIFVRPGDEEKGGAAASPTMGPGVARGPVVLDNGRLRLTVDPATGEWASLMDAASGRELLQAGGGGNRLAARVDRPTQWDAWNLDDTDDPYLPVADTVRVSAAGKDALGSWVEVTRADENGRFVQRMTLPDGERRVHVETTALWRADHKILKAAFPLALSFDSVWAEIPYGAMGRPARAHTGVDSARYEVTMQRWLDASDGTVGVSVVNDGKHGYDVRGDTLRISLLKAPKWPDDQADMGTHTFTYDVVVHDGDWRTGATESDADDLNRPLRAVKVDAHAGEGRSRGFVTVTGPGVQLGALKVSEDDGHTLVLRLVERHGTAAAAEVSLPWAFEWRSADLLERPEAGSSWTPSDGNGARIPLKAWEIGTVLVRKR